MLNIDLQLILAQLLTFLVGMLLLWRIVYKPLTGMLQQRRAKIDGDLQAARDARAEMEKLKDDYERQIAGIAEQSRQLKLQATNEAQRAREEILAAARKQGEELLQRAESMIALEQAKALKALRQEIVALSLQAAEKAIGASADEALHRRMVERMFAELEQK